VPYFTIVLFYIMEYKLEVKVDESSKGVKSMVWSTYLHKVIFFCYLQRGVYVYWPIKFGIIVTPKTFIGSIYCIGELFEFRVICWQSNHFVTRYTFKQKQDLLLMFEKLIEEILCFRIRINLMPIWFSNWSSNNFVTWLIHQMLQS
jgi:hypothetical protein